ncbi:MAG: RNA polymerase sigma factor [Paludibacteraceae bacterium]
MSDGEYIEAFRNDNQRIITTFYSSHRQVFFNNIGSYYRIYNADLLSEIFQEAVFRLWKNIKEEKLTEEKLTTSLAGYLYSIGKIVALEIFRREDMCVELDEDKLATINSDADGLWGWESEQERAVREIVYAMKEPCASLLLMFYWDKLSWETIAKQLDYKDANSAKTQKYKCLQKLKTKFL